MSVPKKEIHKLQELIQSEEPIFFKYLVDCCDNILKNPELVDFQSPCLQLMKLRAEVTQRLEQIYRIKYR